MRKHTRYLSIPEAANYLSLSVAQVEEAIASRKIGSTYTIPSSGEIVLTLRMVRLFDKKWGTYYE